MINNNLFVKNFAIVVVLYKTNFYETAAYISLNEAIKKNDKTLSLEYFVFDNSPEPIYNDSEKLKKDGIYYKHDLSNPGLSKPSNEGADIALQNDKKWVLFTNPDTLYPLDYFEKLLAAVILNPSIELFVPILVSNLNIVSPAKYQFFIGSSPQNVIPGINNLEKKLILYSGMFISLNAFYKSGGFKNEIKLDFMDCYFSENYKKNYPSFFLLDVKCQHDLSSFETNVDKVLIRFKYYCEGAKYFASSKNNSVSLFCICLIRSFILSFRLKNLSFPSIVFKVFTAK